MKFYKFLKIFIFRKFFEKCGNDVQPPKAKELIDSTEGGIDICDKLQQYSKALIPIDFKEEGFSNITSLIELHFDIHFKK